MLNHKTIITIVALCLFSLAQTGEKGNKAEADYRIEVPVDRFIEGLFIKREAKEIKFISPDGKVIKTLPFDFEKDRGRVIIAPTFKYLIKATDIKGEWKWDTLGQLIKVKEPKVKFSYINAKGQIKWHKEYGIIYTLDEAYDDHMRPYFFRISQNGDKIVLVRSQGQWYGDLWSEIVVFDTTGQELAVVSRAPFIEDAGLIYIAPDGKVITAEGYLFKEDKGVLFFLDVETGKTKLVNRR